jgi:hypothetical protein
MGQRSGIRQQIAYASSSDDTWQKWCLTRCYQSMFYICIMYCELRHPRIDVQPEFQSQRSVLAKSSNTWILNHFESSCSSRKNERTSDNGYEIRKMNIVRMSVARMEWLLHILSTRLIISQFLRKLCLGLSSHVFMGQTSLWCSGFWLSPAAR